MAASGVGDAERVPGVGLGLTRMQVREPAHRQPGQVSHVKPKAASDRDGERADRGDLVHDSEHRPVALQPEEQRSQRSFVVGKRPVGQLPGSRIKGDRVVDAFAVTLLVSPSQGSRPPAGA